MAIKYSKLPLRLDTKEGIYCVKYKMMILLEMYRKLYQAFGPQHWWPGNTPFEIAVGAILTQNTNWGNVEKAIQNLKRHDALSARALHEMHLEELA